MKTKYKISVILILFCSSIISLFFYFHSRSSYDLNSLEYRLIRISMIIVCNLFFYSLIFLLDINIYRRIFVSILILITGIWLYELFSWAYLNTSPISLSFGIFWETIILLLFSLISQGLIIYIIYYVKKSTARYNESQVFIKYHIHEGFVGIILILISLFLLIIRSSLLFLTDILWKRFSFFLWLVQIFLYIFIYLGSFLIFRDWHDIKRFKWIEKKNSKEIKTHKHFSDVIECITHEDIPFFKSPKLIYYPFGIIFTIIGIYAIIYGNYLFGLNLENEYIIIFGYFLSFIAGGLIGRDWLRIFRIIYPDMYEEIEQVLKILNHK